MSKYVKNGEWYTTQLIKQRAAERKVMHFEQHKGSPWFEQFIWDLFLEHGPDFIELDIINLWAEHTKAYYEEMVQQNAVGIEELTGVTPAMRGIKNG